MHPNIQLLLQGVIFLVLLTIASIGDLRTRTIPDKLCICIALSGLIYFTPVQLLGALIAIPFLMIAISCGGMGGGDIKFIAASGIVLGFEGAVIATIVGLSANLLYYVFYSVMQSIRKRDRIKAFPLVPFLSIGCVTAFILKLGGLL